MTGPEAEQVAARMSIHLRRNEFAACREILDESENRRDSEEVCTESTPIPIAEVLGHELRYVNKLENAGYVYIEDLDDVVLASLSDKFSPLYLPWFGEKGVSLIEKACERAVEIRIRRGRERRRRLERLERVGEPLLVERSE